MKIVSPSNSQAHSWLVIKAWRESEAPAQGELFPGAGSEFDNSDFPCALEQILAETYGLSPKSWEEPMKKKRKRKYVKSGDAVKCGVNGKYYVIRRISRAAGDRAWYHSDNGVSMRREDFTVAPANKTANPKFSVGYKFTGLNGKYAITAIEGYRDGDFSYIASAARDSGTYHFRERDIVEIIGRVSQDAGPAQAAPKDIHLQNDYDSLYRECGQKDKLLDVLQKERDDIMNEHNHCLALIDQLTKKCARLQSIVSAFIEGRL